MREVAEKSGRWGDSSESPLLGISMSDWECGAMGDEARHSHILKILGTTVKGLRHTVAEIPEHNFRQACEQRLGISCVSRRHLA